MYNVGDVVKLNNENLNKYNFGRFFEKNIFIKINKIDIKEKACDGNSCSKYDCQESSLMKREIYRFDENEMFGYVYVCAFDIERLATDKEKLLYYLYGPKKLDKILSEQSP